jgi:hypothetical protein
MPRKNWDESLDDNEFLIDLLFETKMSLSQIAKEVDMSINDLNKRINSLGLSWIKEHHKKMSRGQAALTAIMQKLLPGEKIVNEFHIGERLKLDVFCPKYNLAAEYHGRQHFYYTQRFFDSKYEFEEAQKRDERKMELCQQNGIALIVFRYNDLLTEQSVYDRMLDAIRNSKVEPTATKKQSIKDNPFYIKAKKENAEKRKQYYKKMKDNKKRNG